MTKSCSNCQREFNIFPKDLEVLNSLKLELNSEIFELPEPSLCPDCRAQRRLSWRNERKYFKSTSSLTGKPLISVFNPDSPVKVYSYDEWWSDAYDPLKYGRSFDFNRTFFEQFRELLTAVPHMAMIGSQNENCNFCHLLANCKNCYLLIESSNCEDCYYSYWLQKCLACVDSSFSHECQYCYEIDNCYNCYKLNYSKDCNNCSNSYFLQSCIGCKDCFGCVNLNHKENYIFNKAVSKAEYQKFINELNFGSYSTIVKLTDKFNTLLPKYPRKYSQILNSEDCTGNYIINSRECFNCYHAHDAEYCRYGEHVWRNSKYNMDVSTVGRDAELVYESINTGISAYHVMFSIQCWSSSEVYYSYCAMNSQKSFGCVGLKNNKFCILNKQYSEAEYYQTITKIIKHMQQTGEWGEFFPSTGSIFPYNESSAQEQYPLTELECQKRKFSWREKNPQEYLVQTYIHQDSIQELNDQILNSVLSCKSCSKNYRIISKELDFYRKNIISIPRICPDCRHGLRMTKRGSAKLYERNCDKCNSFISTPYKDSILGKVYCEACYLAVVV